MQYVIVFHMLSGHDGQWELKKVHGPVESRRFAENKLREWGYSKQEHYQLDEVEGVWLAVTQRNEDVPPNQPQYRIIKAVIEELKSC